MKTGLRHILARLCLVILILLTGCATTGSNCIWPASSTGPVPVFNTAAKIRFAVIGDFGADSPGELAVSQLVKSWKPDFIITTGDNNYPSGEAATIDANIGKYYNEFIHPYPGRYGPGGNVNRFFPSMGNHDWGAACARPYLDYFTLPGNERYYTFVWGPVQFFVLNSEDNEPDGNKADSRQAEWLRLAVNSSQSSFKLVYFHSAPFSSGKKGSSKVMRWPFKAWGVDTVISGDNHIYESIMVDDIAYFVNGLGGSFIHAMESEVPGSRFRYNEDHGAMLITASNTAVLFEFYSTKGKLIDFYTLTKKR